MTYGLIFVAKEPNSLKEKETNHADAGWPEKLVEIFTAFKVEFVVQFLVTNGECHIVKQVECFVRVHESTQEFRTRLVTGFCFHIFKN